MIFTPEHCKMILAGRKTQTRRLLKGGRLAGTILWRRNDIARYWPGQTAAVQPSRGKKSVGRIVVKGLRIETFGAISEADALAEGGYTPEQYREVAREIYGRDMSAEPCVVIEFQLAGAA